MGSVPHPSSAPRTRGLRGVGPLNRPDVGVSPVYAGVEGTTLLRVSGPRRLPRVCGGRGRPHPCTDVVRKSAPRTRG